jgi:hypothetical protein
VNPTPGWVRAMEIDALAEERALGRLVRTAANLRARMAALGVPDLPEGTVMGAQVASCAAYQERIASERREVAGRQRQAAEAIRAQAARSAVLREKARMAFEIVDARAQHERQQRETVERQRVVDTHVAWRGGQT